MARRNILTASGQDGRFLAVSREYSPPAGHKRDLLFDDSIVVSLSSSRSPLMALTAWATKKMKKATSLS